MMDVFEAARATGGRVAGPAARFVGVSTDSRAIGSGELFVALRGERFDGHDFVDAVLAQGAAAVMVDDAWFAAQVQDSTEPSPAVPLIVVPDTRRALGALAAAWRQRFDIPVIGVTGSNGKTTVKEMCAAIFREHLGDTAVLATTGNLNNDIGLPLTLLKLRPDHRAAVIEMGMNHLGEIAYLTGLARPTVALVNNAQRAHLEGLGSVAGVARAKGEIFGGLGPDGVAIINADDPHAGLWRELAGRDSRRPLLTFSIDGSADVTARILSSDLTSRFILHAGGAETDIQLALPGLHNIRNALAAAAATLAAGVPLDTVGRGLSSYRGVKGRLQRKPGLNGATVIDDTYNANPDSMRAAVDVLATMPGKRLFVIGDMGEVGEAGGQFHDELGGYAKSMGVDRLYCLGTLSPAAAHSFGEGGAHFERVEELIRALKPALEAGTTVLVKGSRFMRMERVVEAIISDKEEQHAA